MRRPRGRSWVPLLALATGLAATPGRAAAAQPSCTGSLSGAVAARFDCTVTVALAGDGRTYATISPTAPVEGLPGFAPGSFDVTAVLRPGTWKLDDLGMGKASVAAPGGTLFTATRTTGQRGEVTLVWKRLKKLDGGRWGVSGSYRARLLPVGAGKTGEVLVAVDFEGQGG